ncbi:MAG: pantetheine-phosphate adenylyltransferase [Crocinitomicaceae bacterium]|nr:pantetheine-phosphate adenylyltransferase [Crocinitomicaceae bacterium]|tara:strand:- start:39454 stop:39912 length:459 start_codon:yes stop_codon:yes gene_type:complete
MKKIGLFPGSFDPFTKGHELIVKKSIKIFDEIIIGIGINNSKEYLFDLQKRIKHINSLFEDQSNVKISEFNSLTVNFCKKIDATHIIRGLRNCNDFEYEKTIAQMNKNISGIETLFFLTDEKYESINSSLIREIYKHNGPIEKFVTNAHHLV